MDFEFCNAVRGKRIRVDDSENLANIFRSTSSAAARFSSALDDFLEIYPNFSPAEDSAIDREVSKRFEIIVYRVAELAEAFERASKSFPILTSRKYRESLRRYRSDHTTHFRDWNLICNKLKHNSNQICPVSASYSSGRFALGFTLINPKGYDEFEINRAFHGKTDRSMSYFRALRKIAFDVVKVDASLFKILSGVDDDADCSALNPPPILFMSDASLMKIADIPTTPLPNESKRVNIFTIQNGVVSWSVDHILEPAEDARVSIKYVADGIAKTYPIPVY